MTGQRDAGRQTADAGDAAPRTPRVYSRQEETRTLGPFVASLPMYARPQTAAAEAAFWAELRATCDSAPDALSAPDDLAAHWRAPGLVFSQACGLPLRAGLLEHVALLGTPDYGLPGCPPGYYNSVLVMRANDPRDPVRDREGLRVAVNGFDSQSGWTALLTSLGAVPGDFDAVLESGAHAVSAKMVREDRADLAAIDAQSWRMMQRHDPDAGALREAARTEPTPGLAYICAAGLPAGLRPDPMRAFDRLSPELRQTLGLRGVASIGAEAYRALPLPPRP